MSKSLLFQAVDQFMSDAERNYESDFEEGSMVCEINGDHGSWRLIIHVIDDGNDRIISIHSQLPVRIPECNRCKVIKLLNTINCDLAVGNFVINSNSGEVYFKTTLDLADGEFTQAMFERMYDVNNYLMNKSYVNILSAGFGGVNLELLSVEGRPSDKLLQ